MTIEDLALLFTRGIGSRGAAHLVDYFGSAERLFAASRAELVEGAGLRSELAERIIAEEGMAQAEREVAYCRRHNICTLAATDDCYPELLRDTADRPHVLFVRGRVEALSCESLSVVGTRNMSPSGQHTTTVIIEELAQMVDNLSIVSGLAYGIDGAAHRAALASGATTVAVVANALPDVTPAAHRALAEDILRSGGAIVSEMHSTSPQNGQQFIARNRIIAGLSRGTLVVESPAQGGALATADIADSYHRAVMALPGRITDATSFGTNNLIRMGKARLVLTASDIVEDMGWQRRREPVEVEFHGPDLEVLSDAERRAYDAFASERVVEWSRLLELTGMSMGELSMAVMELEMRGYIRCLPGKKYEVI